jgi:hypothetical protein
MKFSVTTLENYRYIQGIENPDKREQKIQEFIDGLTMQVPPTLEMVRGTAFGKIITAPSMYRNPDFGFTADGYTFPDSTIRDVCSTIDYRSIFEVPVRKIYNLDSEDIVVSGRIDAFLGIRVADFKTKWVYDGLTAHDLNMMFEHYASSVQWMFYLDMVDAHYFDYRIFALRKDDCTLAEQFTLGLERFNGLQSTIMEALYEFRRFVRAYSLEKHFEYSEASAREHCHA